MLFGSAKALSFGAQSRRRLFSPVRSSISLKEIIAVAESVLEAIKQGHWDYEPEDVQRDRYEPTKALPGSTEKLAVMARRLQEGLPLWHPTDRRTFNDEDEES